MEHDYKVQPHDDASPTSAGASDGGHAGDARSNVAGGQARVVTPNTADLAITAESDVKLSESNAHAQRPADEREDDTGAADAPQHSSPSPDAHHPAAGAESTDEIARLRAINAEVRDQDDVERDVNQEAERLLHQQADERDGKRMERASQEKARLEAQILRLHQRMSQPVGTRVRVQLEVELQRLEQHLASVEQDIRQIQERIEDRAARLEDAAVAQAAGGGMLPNESRREFLIRTGKITPFSKIGGREAIGEPTASLSTALIDVEEEREEELAMEKIGTHEEPSHRELKLPGEQFEESTTEEEPAKRAVPAQKRAKRRRVSADRKTYRGRSPPSDEEYVEDELLSDADQLSDESFEDYSQTEAQAPTTKRKRAAKATAESVEDFRGVDDGDERVYSKRLDTWIAKRARARERSRTAGGDVQQKPAGVSQDVTEAETQQPEWLLPHPTNPDFVLDGGLKVPGDIFPFLFDYQKTGVQWLWELYQQSVGGIIGDEMGLGKTIQIIAFLASLHHSGKLDGPIIVVCPPTVMKQWVNEFHQWWPPLRVSILHSSGSGMINIQNETYQEDQLSRRLWDPDYKPDPRGYQSAKKILQRVLQEGHVLVTTYAGLQTYARLLIPVHWAAAILDEGHKIRNPDTAITLHCKELRTSHRMILSGTPMQNNLTELWSLFDFVYPMRLGTLVSFRNQFEIPIRVGGYANASNLQVKTAERCAEILKDAISPYLLQRFKIDVATDLPKKSEQVLFCKLTKVQREAYERFLASDEMTSILRGNREVLYGVDFLRKICNHPDLTGHKVLSHKADYDYGNGAKSGKMQVVKSLLELWRDTGHKTLLFAQHRIMLDILQKFVSQIPGIVFRRMDGNTPIRLRQGMVDEFNSEPGIHLFLLTTKVGGLGVNLTGANRVIIYDPDWNPSTDLQARERAWRLGQKREVSIYRLMAAGTIEEKIYHRQIFKQFLTNKILKDPKQRQSFQMSDLHDLFSLGDDGPTQTSEMFKNAKVKWQQGAKGAAGVAEKPTATPDDSADNRPDSAQPGEEANIRQVAGVKALEAFETGQSQKAASKTDASQRNSEDRLVQGIFARSGVHSAVEHDEIVGGKRVIKADPKILDAEAKRVAAEAAKELEQSMAAAKTVPVGTPTWTGVYGSAGRPETLSAYGGGSNSSRRGGGPSSSSLLQHLASKGKALPGSSGAASPAVPASSGSAPRGKDFMIMIRDYITAHGGSVYTQMLIDHFNRFCTTPRRTAEFKEMLKKIAVLEKTGGRARGKWVLRPQFVAKR
ncbi:hypothetical protein KEM52_000094 [Ascosphaera acerosa]|nr:hypothetical protein KEM52_000094 [Ascosphaera acerosa]